MSDKKNLKERYEELLIKAENLETQLEAERDNKYAQAKESKMWEDKYDQARKDYSDQVDSAHERNSRLSNVNDELETKIEELETDIQEFKDSSLAYISCIAK